MAITPTLIGDVHFTHKEKELLELFSRSPGECFSRRFLLTTIWGYNEHARSRTLDTHVSRLRKKLAAGRNGRILTIVGQGYMLQRTEDHAHAAELDPSGAEAGKRSYENPAPGVR